MSLVYIHIGMGKTGTSAIQHFFNTNRKALLENGLLYAESGKIGNSHKGLAIADSSDVDFFTEIAKEISTSNAPTTLISSEFFCFSRPQIIKNLRDALKPNDGRIVFYVRDQVSLLESAYLQELKIGSAKFANIDAYFESERRAFNFEARINPWASVFGAENIIVRLYDVGPRKTNSCDDMLSLLKVSVNATLPNRKINSSLHLSFARLVLMLNKLPVTSSDRKPIIDEILELSLHMQEDLPRFVQSENFISKVRRFYRESNITFAKKYLDGETRKYFLLQPTLIDTCVSMDQARHYFRRERNTLKLNLKRPELMWTRIDHKLRQICMENVRSISLPRVASFVRYDSCVGAQIDS